MFHPKRLFSRLPVIVATLAVAAGLALAQQEQPAAPTDQPKPQPDEAVQQQAGAALAPAPDAVRKPLIQIAILLDTSNSMDGLINQAKTHLWNIVNQFATAKQNGVRPELHVALYEYGNDGLASGEGFVRLVLPLTIDLDKVSEQLFALKTNGGSEYCGHVIRDAVRGLEWSKSNKDFKAIFIAGNEPFTQGEVPYADACKEAIVRGILVNTIFCGPHAEGVETKWKDGAQLADGSFASIDQNEQLVHIDAPQDAELLKLNDELNKTYVAFGKAGAEGKAQQEAQDANAAGLASSVLVQRAASKSSSFYRNAAWDLCDAIDERQVKLEEVKEEDLPENMRKMTMDERKAYLDQQRKARGEVKEKIQKLTGERDKYVAAERRKQAEAEGKKSLDDAIVESVRAQAAEKSFEFEK